MKEEQLGSSCIKEKQRQIKNNWSEETMFPWVGLYLSSYSFLRETNLYICLIVFFFSQKSNFLSDFGGIIGLFYGLSFLTVFEFAELLLDMISLAFLRHKARASN